MGSYTGTVPALLSGQLPDADKLVEITNLMTALTSAWTTYTPAWTASAGTPAIGNGTLTGKYRLIGKTLDFRFLLTAGSTTTFGTAGAFYTFGNPLSSTADGNFYGVGHSTDSGVQEYPLTWSCLGLAGITFFRTAANGRFLNNAPYTIGANDTIGASGTISIV